MGGSISGGDYFSKVSQNYNNKLYGGASRSEWANNQRAGLQARLNASKVQTTNENIAKIQNAAQMYGVQLDSNSIFMMANTDGNQVLSNKEATAFMSKLPMLAQMNMANNADGASSSGGGGGSNILSTLNSITDTAGNILGAIGGGDGGSSDGGGGFLKKAGDFLGGLFG